LPTIRGFVLRLLCAAAAFVVVEGAVFRTGLYSHVLEPDSTSGLLVTTIDSRGYNTMAPCNGTVDPNTVERALKVTY